MAKRRKHMPKGRGWQLLYNGKSIVESARVRERANLVTHATETC
jgi:hypothetical protein